MKIIIFEILMHMRQMKYVPSPEIMPNLKIPHPSHGDACSAFQGMQKGHVRYQKHATGGGSCLKMDIFVVIGMA